MTTKRLAFLPTAVDEEVLWRTEVIDFEWVPGLSTGQYQKSIGNLHESLTKKLQVTKILEISSKSQDTLGVSLSAFNLRLQMNEIDSSVESVYQGSKVFETGGPFTEIMNLSSLQAKRDERIKTSGNLQHFEFMSQVWELTDSPNFYDFLYIKALTQNEFTESLLEFEAFTDIAFNQKSLEFDSSKSFNCQARAAAIYVSLHRRNQLEAYLNNPQAFQPAKPRSMQEQAEPNLFDFL